MMESPLSPNDLDQRFDSGSRSDVVDGNQRTPDDSPARKSKVVPKNPVDCSRLTYVTMETVQKLEDLKITLDPDAIYRTLFNWVTVLNETFQTLHVIKYGPAGEVDTQTNAESSSGDLKQVDEGDGEQSEEKVKIGKDSAITLTSLMKNEFCYIVDPLFLSSHLFVKVCEMAQACFDIGCHGNILEFHKYVKEDKCEKESDRVELNDVCDTQNRSTNPERVNDKAKNIVDEQAISDLSSSGEGMKAVNVRVFSGGDGVANNKNINETNATADSGISVMSSEKNSFEQMDAEIDDLPIDNSGFESFTVKTNLSTTEITTKTLDRNTKTTIYLVNNEIENNLASVDKLGTLQTKFESSTGKDNSMAFFVRCYLPYLKLCRVREDILEGRLGSSSWCGLVSAMEGRFNI